MLFICDLQFVFHLSVIARGRYRPWVSRRPARETGPLTQRSGERARFDLTAFRDQRGRQLALARTKCRFDQGEVQKVALRMAAAKAVRNVANWAQQPHGLRGITLSAC